MKISEFIQQHNLTLMAERYGGSSHELYNELNIDVLGFDYDLVNDTVTAVVTPPTRFQGNAGVVHGGIVATYIDTVCGIHAIIHALASGKRVFTKTISLSYLAPMLVDKEHVVTSVVVDHVFTCTITCNNVPIARAELVFAFKAIN